MLVEHSNLIKLFFFRTLGLIFIAEIIFQKGFCLMYVLYNLKYVEKGGEIMNFFYKMHFIVSNEF